MTPCEHSGGWLDTVCALPVQRHIQEVALSRGRDVSNRRVFTSLTLKLALTAHFETWGMRWDNKTFFILCWKDVVDGKWYLSPPDSSHFMCPISSFGVRCAWGFCKPDSHMSCLQSLFNHVTTWCSWIKFYWAHLVIKHSVTRGLSFDWWLSHMTDKITMW